MIYYTTRGIDYSTNRCHNCDTAETSWTISAQFVLFNTSHQDTSCFFFQTFPFEWTFVRVFAFYNGLNKIGFFFNVFDWVRTPSRMVFPCDFTFNHTGSFFLMDTLFLGKFLPFGFGLCFLSWNSFLSWENSSGGW